MKKRSQSLFGLALALILCIGMFAGCGSTVARDATDIQSAEGQIDNSETLKIKTEEGSIEPVMSSATPEPTETPKPTPVVNKDGSDKIIHVLLIGMDNNYIGGIDALGNSDGLVIISANLTDHTVALTSILRDTVFNVAGHPYETNKVTLIYHYYGLETLVKSIETDMGITFDNYLAFNYLNIMDLVDLVGGIDTEVYPREIEMANNKLRALNRDLLGCESDDGLFTQDSGTVHMTGKQAVCFMRVRLDDETNNDFGRTERERRVILLLKDKFLELNVVKQASFIKTVLGMIKTDLSVTDALNYLNHIDEYRTYEIRSGRIPQDKAYYGSEGYIHMNLAQNRIFFFDQVYGDNGGMPVELEEELAALQADLDAGNGWKYYTGYTG